MHSLEFMTTWLLGAASTGDKKARAGLTYIFPSLVGELSWDLEMLRSGVVNGNAQDISQAITKLLGGFAKPDGLSCTDFIIQTIKQTQGEYAARTVAAAAMTLPKDKLIPALKDMLAVLEKAETNGKSQ